MKSPLLGYKLGLGILGGFTLALLIFVLVQANSTKQDLQTTKQANAIADMLNNYTLNNASVPGTLADADIKNIPSTISYQRQSATNYEFCITYRSAGGTFPLQTIFDGVTNTLTGLGGTDSPPSYNPSSLVIPDSHAKGKTCQTITIDNTIMPLNQGSSTGSNDSSLMGNSITQ